MIQIEVTRYTICQLEKAINDYNSKHKDRIQDYNTMINVVLELFVDKKLEGKHD